MSCQDCKEARVPESVPYIVHEGMMARMERAQKRLTIIVVLLIVLLVGTNMAWMAYESQFEDVVTSTYEADATDGGNAIVNGDGSVNINGEG